MATNKFSGAHAISLQLMAHLPPIDTPIEGTQNGPQKQKLGTIAKR